VQGSEVVWLAPVSVSLFPMQVHWVSSDDGLLLPVGHCSQPLAVIYSFNGQPG